jgi:hypothetical protein
MKKFYLSKLVILLALLLGVNKGIYAQPLITVSFTYTGAVQTFTVPIGVTILTVDAVGNVGGNSSTGQRGGYGGRVQCALSVTGGEVLYINVGGPGHVGVAGNSEPPGFNDSGANGGWCTSITGYGGGGGGGASDIRANANGLANRVIVSGGGGGGGSNCTDPGGNGGSLTGQSATPCSDGAGGGGSQTGGGTGGVYSGYGTANNGVLGWGGIAATTPYQSPGSAGGGGGGGYYGGGGGSWGGGGGGSSYTDVGTVQSISTPIHTQGYNTTGVSYINLQMPSCVTPTTGTISGSSAGCIGTTTQYTTNSTAGGVWSSSNPAVASVGSSTGLVSSLSPGTASISYALILSCGSAVPAPQTITVNPSPAPITGSSNVCSATPATLSSTTTGGTWSSSNSAVATIGSSSGVVTGASQGVITITYTSLGCTTLKTVSVNISPNVYTVSGGGAYCNGSTAPNIILSNSDALISYSLYNGVTLVSTLSGVGHSLNFGSQAASGVYTVLAVNPNGGCSVNMSGSATVTMNIPPTANNVTAPGGATSYCAGGAGVSIGLNGSTPGISYQLYAGTAMAGTAYTGMGGAFTFPSMATTAGVYTVIGTNTSTGCTTVMNGSETVSINPNPNIYTVTGSGNYCIGSNGLPVGLTGADLSLVYRLYDGSVLEDTVVAEATGVLSFGNMTATGTYVVTAINPVTGCHSAMDGSAVIGTNPLPAAYPITGGGAYCAGGAGEDIGLSYSTSGIHYQLYNGSTAEGVYKTGTGAALDYGFYAPAGSYSVVATNPITGCTSNLSAPAVITINPLPAVNTVTGTAGYCAGGTGVNVYLSNSTSGISYKLYNGATLAGTVASTGGAFGFGLQTMAGTYTATAVNTTTGCTSNMAGNAVVTINPLPVSYPLSGGGNYCSGGSGVSVTLGGSTPGISYQAQVGGMLTGTAMTGTGSALTFNSEMATGPYTVLALNTSTSCSSIMTGMVTVAVNPLPTPFDVTGGGTYCTGGAGFHVGLGYSNTGVNYQLYNGASAYGSPVAGTGAPIDFGVEHAAGNYTVVARNTITNCMSTMPGSATISTVALPTVYAVTGGGSYCSGGAGVPFGLSGSTIGINYILYNGGAEVDSLGGNGISLNFAPQTMAGSYSVVAVNPSSNCTSTMTGGTSVTVNPLPSAYSVSGGGGYCAGGTGVNVYLGGSASGVSYQLMNGSLATGTAVNGTGSMLNFGTQTAAGPYTVLATDNTTHCSAGMTGGATVIVNTLPAAYTVTGGGGYCVGGSGVHIGLSGSDVGVNYQLNNGSPVGMPISVSGGTVDFGAITMAGSYSVIATNALTGCTTTMAGSVPVTVNALPVVYAVTGGGAYCSDGAGVPVGLSGSATGIGYQLYNGTTAVGIPSNGTGSALDFGTIGVPGTYNVVATNISTTCSSNMTSGATVTINPTVNPTISVSSPSGYTVCAGTPVTFNSMATNGGATPSYQWSVNGMAVPGALSTSYNYSPADGDVITAMLTSSNVCARPASVMSAPVTMLVNAVGTPNISVTASTGSTVCSGTNVTFSAAPSFGGLAPVYLWKKNGVPVGSDVPYYSVVPQNGDNIFCTMTTSYPCASLPVVYSNQVNMTVDTLQTPVVTVTANPSTNVSMGENVTFGATVDFSGAALSYQWMMNNSAIPGATTNTYTTSNSVNGDVVSCTVTNDNVCGTASGSNSVTMSVGNLAVKQVTNGGSNIALLPNPNKGAFTLKGTLATTGNQTISVEITNMLGQVVYTGKIIPQNGVVNEYIQMNSSLANGMYLLDLHSETESTVIHFVIEQ